MTQKTKAPLSSYNPGLAALLIRVGLAAVFLYAAIGAFRQPIAWQSFVPAFSNKFIAAKTALNSISVVQIGLAIWLISGKYLKYAAAVSTVLLGSIMIFNLNTLLITFRDIGLVAASLALCFLDE